MGGAEHPAEEALLSKQCTEEQTILHVPSHVDLESVCDQVCWTIPWGQRLDGSEEASLLVQTGT